MFSRNNDLKINTYTITELARESKVTTRAIRFYEDQGLLNPHRDGHKRIYNNRDRTRLKLILRGKRLGFTLSDIRELFELFDSTRGEEKQLYHFLKNLRERRTLLKQQQRDIEAVLHEIDGAEAICLKRLDKLKSARRSIVNGNSSLHDDISQKTEESH